MIAHILLRSFVCTKTRIPHLIPQLVRSLIPCVAFPCCSAVAFCRGCCLAMRRALVFFSFWFFRACVASVRYDVFVWQEGACLLEMAPRLLLGPLLPFPILKEGGNPTPVRLSSFIIIYRRPVNVRTHNRYNGPSVSFFP